MNNAVPPHDTTPYILHIQHGSLPSSQSLQKRARKPSNANQQAPRSNDQRCPVALGVAGRRRTATRRGPTLSLDRTSIGRRCGAAARRSRYWGRDSARHGCDGRLPINGSVITICLLGGESA